MYLDPVEMLPIDFEVYKFDLDKANKFDIEEWTKIYDYRNTYGLENLSPSSFLKHSEKIFQYEETAKLYRNQKEIEGPAVNITEPCDQNCRQTLYCETTANDYDEWQYCFEHDKR
jgi:hypothetical protein